MRGNAKSPGSGSVTRGQVKEAEVVEVPELDSEDSTQTIVSDQAIIEEAPVVPQTVVVEEISSDEDDESTESTNLLSDDELAALAYEDDSDYDTSLDEEL